MMTKKKFSFEATIYKVGINPCVDVPLDITDKMIPSKGYILIKGKIRTHPFLQTLVTVKNAPYRLYVNGPMLKGSGTKPGDKVKFSIEQNFEPKIEPMPKQFEKKLNEKGLMPAFKKLTPGRQKEIIRYLNSLKTEESLLRNIDKAISRLERKDSHFPVPF
jgi:hypothetical protein